MRGPRKGIGCLWVMQGSSSPQMPQALCTPGAGRGNRFPLVAAQSMGSAGLLLLPGDPGDTTRAGLSLARLSGGTCQLQGGVLMGLLCAIGWRHVTPRCGDRRRLCPSVGGRLIRSKRFGVGGFLLRGCDEWGLSGFHCLYPLHKVMQGLWSIPGPWRRGGEMADDGERWQTGLQTPNAVTASLQCSQGVGCSTSRWGTVLITAAPMFPSQRGAEGQADNFPGDGSPVAPITRTVVKWPVQTQLVSNCPGSQPWDRQTGRRQTPHNRFKPHGLCFAVYPVFPRSQPSTAPRLCCDSQPAGAESPSPRQRPKAVQSSAMQYKAVQCSAAGSVQHGPYQLPWACSTARPLPWARDFSSWPRSHVQSIKPQMMILHLASNMLPAWGSAHTPPASLVPTSL